MRRSLIVAAVTAAPILASAMLPATANSAVRASLTSDAVVTAVSCAPGGGCAAGGNYVDASSREHAFVLTERNGRWGAAIEVPGLAALSPKYASISSVSCAVGGCVAGGFYQNQAAGGSHAFVTSETNGRWSRLTRILTAGKSSRAGTDVSSLSCSGPRNCTAGGGRPAFVVSEIDGRWGRAHEFGAEGRFATAKVSCASAGNCSAGWNTFVVSDRNGRWGKPMALPGLSALGTGAGITSLSCTAPGNCAVGGTYRSRSGTEVFVARKRHGRWRKAIEIPGFTALNKAGGGELAGVSCISAGNCVAGGSYAVPADFAGGAFAPFVASERNGRWGKAIEVPGIPPATSTLCEPDTASCVSGQVLSVSCAPGGICAAGGSYDTPAISGWVAFVVTYTNGHWTKVTQIRGLAALDTAKMSGVNSVSCTPAGKCGAGGSYLSTSPQVGRQAFVVDENNGTWGQAHTVSFRS